MASVCISSVDMATNASRTPDVSNVGFWGNLGDIEYGSRPLTQELTTSLLASLRVLMLSENTFSGLQLRHPVVIMLQWDEGECLVTSWLNTWLIDTYGVGETEEEAIANFLSSLAFDYRWLLENEDKLAARLALQLNSLKSLLDPVAD